MNQATGTERVDATARESALYQAGYEAGMAKALQGKAAELGALGVTLDAFVRTCVSIRTAAMNLRVELAPAMSEGAKKSLVKSTREVLSQIESTAEMLNRSLLEQQAQAQSKAKDANEQSELARKVFAECVDRANSLGRKKSVTERVARFARALKGIDQ